MSFSFFVFFLGAPGTRDETAFCCVPTALTLYRGLGVERVRQYNTSLVDAASKHLAQVWNSEILAPPSLRGAYMSAIRVPLPFDSADSAGTSAHPINSYMLSPIGHEVLHDLLQSNYCIEYVKLFNFGKRVWVRIACQIYNQLEDYIRLGDAVLHVINQGCYMQELLKRMKNFQTTKQNQ